MNTGGCRIVDLLGEENFDEAGGVGRVVLGACAAAGGKETRGQYAGVVQNEEIAGLEEVGEVGEEVVAQGPGCSVEDQHAARSALGRRVLGDEFRGQVEAEVGDKHWFKFSCGRGSGMRQKAKTDSSPFYCAQGAE